MGRIDGGMALAKAIQIFLFFVFLFACQLLVDIPHGFFVSVTFSRIFLRSTGTIDIHMGGKVKRGGGGHLIILIFYLLPVYVHTYSV